MGKCKRFLTRLYDKRVMKQEVVSNIKRWKRKLKRPTVDRVLINLLYLFVALLPLTYWGTIEVGFTLKLSEVVAFVTFSLWLLVRLRRRDFSWRRTPLDIPLIGFLIVTALSLSQAINLERGIAWWIWLAFYMFGVYYLIVNLVTSEKVLRRLIKVYVVTSSIVVFLSIYQFFADYTDLPFTLMRPGYSKFGSLAYPRPHATLREPLLLGNYLLFPTIFLAVSFISKKALFFKSWVEGALLFLFTTVIIITLSRGAAVALVGALALLSLAYWGFRLFKSKKEFTNIFASVWPRFFVFVAAVVLSVPAFFGMTKLGVYLEDIWETSNERIESKRAAALAETSRLSLGDPRYRDWELAWEMFKEKPLLGVGWGNFGPTKFGVSRGLVGTEEQNFHIVNNEPLEVAVESGIFGFVFYLWFSGVFVWEMFVGIYRSVRQKLYSGIPIFLGFLFSFLALFAQYLTFSTIQVGHFWFVLGLGVVAAQVLKRDWIN